VNLGRIRCFYGVHESAHVGISVRFGTGIGIIRYVGIQEFTCFTPFYPFRPESPFLGL